LSAIESTLLAGLFPVKLRFFAKRGLTAEARSEEFKMKDLCTLLLCGEPSETFATTQPETRDPKLETFKVVARREKSFPL
jgi:hypothetical protein